MKIVSKEVKEIHVALEPLKNPIPTRELEAAYAQNPRVLALLRDFRAFDWIKEYKYPTVMLDQMKGLLAKYEHV